MWKRLAIACIVLPIVVFLTMQYAPVLLVKVVGHSMDYTLYNGQYALAVRRQHTDIQRGDIIIGTVQVKRSWIEDDPVEDATITILIIKRVVGLPNEQIRIAKGRVYVNGQLLEEPYVEKQDGWTYTPTITLGADQYYVLGDNRIESLDSRVFGPLNVNQIIGKLVTTPYPFRDRASSGWIPRDCSPSLKIFNAAL